MRFIYAQFSLAYNSHKFRITTGVLQYALTFSRDHDQHYNDRSVFLTKKLKQYNTNKLQSYTFIHSYLRRPTIQRTRHQWMVSSNTTWNISQAPYKLTSERLFKVIQNSIYILTIDRSLKSPSIDIHQRFFNTTVHLPETMFTILYGMPMAWLNASALAIISSIISQDLLS